MRIEKHFYLLTIITAILCTPACGEVELPREVEPLLIGQPNPSLAGLEELYVLVAPTDSEPNRNARFWKEIETQIENKLKDAGIKLFPSDYLREGAIPLGIPTLKAEIGMLKLNDSQQYVFHIQMSLSRMVRLVKQPKVDLMVDVWKTEPAMQVTSVEDMPATVRGAVLEQVEAFIHAYLAANPPDKKAADADNATISSREITGPAAKMAAAEYKFVASKNSQVFHRGDCSSAKRIDPENLIGYNSPDEAIAASKRPCKRCKP